MGYQVLTLTHREVPTHQLEHLMVSADEPAAVYDHLHRIKTNMGLDELYYLNTCNRVLYFCYTDQEPDTRFLLRFLREVQPSIDAALCQQLAEKLRSHQGEAALRHLFQVAASIDSMVVGEREILRQLRAAYEQGAAQGLSGDFIRLAIQEAVRTAKQVYHETRIGEKPVSIVSLAIQALLDRHPDRSRRIVLLGAGQTMQLVAKFLRKHRFENITVFNRSLDKAMQVAEDLNAKAYPLDRLSEYGKGFDILITCTGHTSSWIDTNIYGSLLSGEQDQKIVVDLAVPTNVRANVPAQYAMDYIQVDDLRKIAKQNLTFREQEVEHARHIITDHEAAFKGLLAERYLEKALQEIPTQIKDIKSKAVNEVFRKELEHLDADSLALINRMMDYMEKKCIAIPMKAAKKLVR